ncbi:MAG: isoaspartyl peptidase/L-asparaginase [Ktedonobacteraceae bacterium]|nr:isoaspartyl peptidase/L-asparaginase [Ktedonobacteraceae bacterium]
MPMAIIVHGGAGTISLERAEAAQKGCKAAAAVGWQVLQAGGSALDAVEAAVRALEDNPDYNAGTGSCLTRDGNIEMDAGIMEGQTLRVGAVASVEFIKNPVSLARAVLESPHVLLAGTGARQFALERGIQLCSLEDLMTERQYTRWKSLYAVQSQQVQPEEQHGTVWAAAIDSSGHLAAATSTGGIPGKYPGRIGDSPLVGCGFYADEDAAVSCTGHGEDFIRLLLARRAGEFVTEGMSAPEAAHAAIRVLRARTGGSGGLIIVDYRGKIGFANNSNQMARAYITEGMDEPVAAI